VQAGKTCITIQFIQQIKKSFKHSGLWTISCSQEEAKLINILVENIG